MISGWVPRDEWERLVRGDGCPLCEDMEPRRAGDHVDAYGRTIALLDASELRLCADQFTPGYCVVISTRHVAEPYELPDYERGVFFADVLRGGKAVQQALGSIKMNYLILGNEQPHLHCHLIPRYYGDHRSQTPTKIYSAVVGLHSRTCWRIGLTMRLDGTERRLAGCADQGEPVSTILSITARDSCPAPVMPLRRTA